MKLQLPLVYLEHPSPQVSNAPLLVMLHGYGSHEEDLFSMRHALFPGFHIISLRAPVSLPWGGFAWFGLEFTETGIKINQQDALEAQSIVAQTLREIKNWFHRPVILMGFSQGTIMSFHAAIHQPDLVDGIIGFSGRLVESILPENGQNTAYSSIPVIQTHGSMDPVIPVSEGRKASEILKKLGFKLDYKEYTFAHEISMNCLQDINQWITVHYNHFNQSIGKNHE